MGEQYTLRLLVDDSAVRALEKRISKIMGISGGSQAGGASGGGLFGGGIAKNILKLSTIAIGVASLVTLVKKISSLVVDSSPVLNAMFKLFNTSLLFIFRPIGDFIGFFLRPIVIFFLRNIALPWYRLAGPIMRQWGSSIGNNLVAFLSNPLGGIQEWFEGLDFGALLGIVNLLNPLNAIQKAAELFNIDLGGVTAGISEKVTSLLDGMSNVISPIVSRFSSIIKNRIQNIVEFFAGAWGFIKSILQPAWDSIMGFFKSLADFFKPLIDFFTGGRGEGEHTTFTQSGQAGARGGKGNVDNSSASTVINFYDTHLDATNTEQDFEEKVLSVIERTGRGKAGRI